MKKKLRSVTLYEDYVLYEDGRLYSKKTKLFRKWLKAPNGYMKTGLYVNNKQINISQHRVLTQSFIPNPEKKPVINHKNGIKDDNRLSNLEWCTPSENNKHAIVTGLFKPIGYGKRRVIDTSTGVMYESMASAYIHSGYTKGHFYNMLSGFAKNKTTFKFYDRKRKKRSKLAGGKANRKR